MRSKKKEKKKNKGGQMEALSRCKGRRNKRKR
jgi:hypothetical protein